MIKIRLARHGTKKKPFYWVVIINSRTQRNGHFVEKVGFYKPKQSKCSRVLYLNKDRIQYWKSVGAQCSLIVNNLIKKST